MKLEGKHALVTGAGAGIGRAIALRFAQEGARVTIVDFNAEKGESVAQEIRAAGGEALAVLCDVAEQDQVEAAVAAARAAFGPIDILINNAGGGHVGGPLQKFEECTREYMDRVMGTNLNGTLFFTRAILPEMMERRTGRIVNFSSIRGIAGDSWNVFYSTAKAGIIGFTKSLAMITGKYGITVNSIAPGAINSRPGPGNLPNYIGRPGTCEEVAALVLFIVGDEGGFMTGENVVIDGGRTLGCKGE